MDAPEHLSDGELLQKFRVDYQQALEMEDYTRIYTIIVPQFWEHFAKYYHEYENSWKDLPIFHLPIHVMIDPMEKRQAEIGWVEQVLKGRIELAP
jgi:hypothetical protein